MFENSARPVWLLQNAKQPCTEALLRRRSEEIGAAGDRCLCRLLSVALIGAPLDGRLCSGVIWQALPRKSARNLLRLPRYRRIPAMRRSPRPSNPLSLEGNGMRALCWHGKNDIRCDHVPDPEIEAPRDAIVRVTSTAICGSDLHLRRLDARHGSGDIMGHEFMGEVVEVGPGNHKLKVGDRVVVPFTIACGECDQCRRGYFSVCERSNRNKETGDKVFGHTTAGLFGYTHLTGGYPAARPSTCACPMPTWARSRLRTGSRTSRCCFSATLFPTGWQAVVQCDIEPTDTVAIWGCGPVGQFCIRSAILLGARQVIAIDCVAERLAMAEAGGATTVNFQEESVVERLNDLTSGRGREVHRCGRDGGARHRDARLDL